MKKIIWCFLMAYHTATFASNYDIVTIQSNQQLWDQTRRYQSEVNDYLSHSNAMKEIYHQEANAIKDNLVNDHINKKIDNDNHYKNPSIIIFVSFSMPDNSVEAILHDAKKVGANVLIRGLLNDSFQKTFKKIAKLNVNSGGNGVELNPVLFKELNIKSVPAVVVMSDSSCLTKHNCQLSSQLDIVTGNISLEAALKMVRDKGIAKKTAQAALTTLRGDDHA